MRRLPVLLLALLACREKPDDTDPGVVLPPAICNDPVSLPDEDWFYDRTEEHGLADVRGNRITAVDFEDDGWVDLLVNPVASHVVNDFAGTRYNWLLKNDHGTFVDVTEASGVTAYPDGTDGRAFGLASWGDVDNDGDLDLFTGTWHDRNNESTWTDDTHRVLLNDGDGTFTLAPESDVNYDSTSSGATMVDFDRDGNLDLWVTSWYVQYGASYAGEQDRLLLGKGDGTFRDVTDDVGLERIETGSTSSYLAGTSERAGFAAAACDVDDDGDSDLLASNYGRQWNSLWRNDDGAFTDVGMESGYAGDENLDYSDNEFYKCWCESNACDPDPGAPSVGCGDYWNDGFDDQPARLNGNTFTTVCGDIDNDGDMDLYNAEIVHWHIGQSSDESELLLNDGTGTFTRPGNDNNGLRRPRPSGWNEGDLMAEFVDIDNDGWKDILLASSDYPDTHAWLFRQVAPGQFEDVSETSELYLHEFASGMAVADFDRDGDQDLVMGQSTARGGAEESFVLFWENALGPGNHSRIRLVGGDANRRGFGARVTVEAGDLVQTFDVGGSYGHMGVQNDADLWVGLGGACTIDRITVRWPDEAGTTVTYEGVLANYDVRLHQGGGVEYVTE